MTHFARASLTDQAYTLPARYYTSDEVLAQEHERIFGRCWVFAGHSATVAAPGAYLLLNLGHESLIIVRDQQGTLHAHYNVCRHRGTRICTTEQGQFGSSIQCPYHAWTYGLDGSLLAARLMQNVEGFDKADYPLVGAHVAEWEGCIFVSLAAEPEPFAQAFAPLLGRFADWDMAGLQVAHTVDYDVQANWKMIAENYSECYHCPLIHPALAQLSDSSSGRNDLSEGPFLGGYMTLDEPGGSLTTNGQTPRPPLGHLSGANLHRVYYYALFPNMLLSLHPDYVMTHRLLPLAPGRVHIRCQWLFDPQTMARPDFDPSDAVEFWDMTNRQDWHVCELSQLGVQSRAYVPGPYAHEEGLLYAFDQHYRHVLEDA